MKKYVIVKSVNETDRIAKFHAESGNRYIGKYHGSYCAIVDEYDTLYAANDELTDIAMTDAESDCNISPNCHSWALFCASVPNRAGSDKRTHYRWYSDGDCTRYEVYDTESNDTEIERAIYDLYHKEDEQMKEFTQPINTEQDVKAFFRHLVHDLKINLHPDDDFILVSPTKLTPAQSDHYNKLLDDCFAVCGDERIYDIANDIIKEEGGI